jgi:hypothetical protein
MMLRRPALAVLLGRAPGPQREEDFDGNGFVTDHVASVQTEQSVIDLCAILFALKRKQLTKTQSLSV